MLEDDTKTTNWGLFQVVDGQVDDENRVVSQTETNEGIMPEGIFVVLSRSTLRPIDCALVPESHMSRALSVNPSGDSAARASSFTRRIRDRDGGCCLSNVTYAALNDSWSTLEAAHIFPHGKLSIVSSKVASSLINMLNHSLRVASGSRRDFIYSSPTQTQILAHTRLIPFKMESYYAVIFIKPLMPFSLP